MLFLYWGGCIKLWNLQDILKVQRPLKCRKSRKSLFGLFGSSCWREISRINLYRDYEPPAAKKQPQMLTDPPLLNSLQWLWGGFTRIQSLFASRHFDGAHERKLKIRVWTWPQHTMPIGVLMLLGADTLRSRLGVGNINFLNVVKFIWCSSKNVIFGPFLPSSLCGGSVWSWVQYLLNFTHFTHMWNFFTVWPQKHF